MLNELYRYACDSGVSTPPGYKNKKIKGYVSLTGDGKFIGLLDAPEGGVMVPDIGSAAQGPSVCNILTEKVSVVFGLAESDGKVKNTVAAKHAFFIDSLSEGAEYEPMFGVCAEFLKDTANYPAVLAALAQDKVKNGEIIGFCVDGRAIEDSKNYAGWWDGLRRKYAKSDGGSRRCFISGEETVPPSTVAKISGLIRVGGHSSGDALICFDKEAFESYGLEKAANSAVSEEAITAVNRALEGLIQKAPPLAGSKFIHWYEKPLPPGEQDAVEQFFGSDGGEADEDDEESQGEDDREGEENTVSYADKAEAERTASRLVRGVYTGKKTAMPDNTYYILKLSGASGRVMVRGWQTGRYEDLKRNIDRWFDDLGLVSMTGKGTAEIKSLSKYYYRLLKRGKFRKSVAERTREELAGLDMQIVYAIINGTALPDAVGVKALNYIRSKLMDNDKEDQHKKDENASARKPVPMPDQAACQLLKAWLNRYYINKKEDIVLVSPSLNPERMEKAYQAGRMMAVYAKIQNVAYEGKVAAGVVERYYAAACTSPALVIGRLSALSAHHFSKLDKGLAICYQNMLDDIAAKIVRPMPSAMNLPERAEFALGYYQQMAEMKKKKDKNPENGDDENNDDNDIENNGEAE